MESPPFNRIPKAKPSKFAIILFKIMTYIKHFWNNMILSLVFKAAMSKDPINNIMWTIVTLWYDVLSILVNDRKYPAILNAYSDEILSVLTLPIGCDQILYQSKFIRIRWLLLFKTELIRYDLYRLGLLAPITIYYRGRYTPIAMQITDDTVDFHIRQDRQILTCSLPILFNSFPSDVFDPYVVNFQ